MNTRIGDQIEERDLFQDTDTHSTVSVPFHRRQSTFTAGSSSSRRYSTVSESSNITLTHFTTKNKKTEAFPSWFKGRRVSPIYENTYQLCPPDDKQLQEHKIMQLLDETLEEHFMPAIYDGQESKKVKYICTQQFTLFCNNFFSCVLHWQTCCWKGSNHLIKKGDELTC